MKNWLLVLVLVLFVSTPSEAQMSCIGYDDDECRLGWMVQAGYMMRLDQSDLGSKHIVTVELGPVQLVEARRVHFGISLVAGVDEHRGGRLGAKLRGGRGFGPVTLDLGFGGLFIDERSRSIPSFTGHLGLTFWNHVQLVGGLDVYQLDFAGSDSEGDVFAGINLVGLGEKGSSPIVIAGLVAAGATLLVAIF